MHHFGPYHSIVRACIAAFAICLCMSAEASAEVKRPAEEIRLGVADVERILQGYWRTPRVRADLEQYRTSEEFRQKQNELSRLERELASRRFTFFQRNRLRREVQEKRKELQAMAEKETGRTREREREAVEELMTDIRRGAEAIGRQKQLTVIFDSNTPHILFSNTYATGIDDVTDSVIQNLNFR